MQHLRSLKTLSLAACLAFSGVFAAFVRSADSRPAPAAPLANAIEGVWVLVGNAGKVGPVQPGSPIKFRINGHWSYTRADPASGIVKLNFGGTYSVTDSEYIEVIKYSSDPKDKELNKSLKFRVKVEGDTMTQTGIGNSYNETWKRLR